MRVYGQLASRLQHIMMKRTAFPTATHAGQLLLATPSMTEEQRWVTLASWVEGLCVEMVSCVVCAAGGWCGGLRDC